MLCRRLDMLLCNACSRPSPQVTLLLCNPPLRSPWCSRQTWAALSQVPQQLSLSAVCCLIHLRPLASSAPLQHSPQTPARCQAACGGLHLRAAWLMLHAHMPTAERSRIYRRRTSCLKPLCLIAMPPLPYLQSAACSARWAQFSLIKP
jgi:hypothetical protein